jgi:ribosome-binding factor A
MKSLEATAADVQHRTRRGLDDTNKSGPTPRRLAEAHRIMEVTTDCLEEICMRGEDPGLTLSGEPIVILEVQVNRDVKQAKVFWTLPYVVLLDERINQNVYQKLMMKLQDEIQNGGSGKVLSHLVRTRLSHYYPPRIKLVPATNDMVRNAMKEYLD